MAGGLVYFVDTPIRRWRPWLRKAAPWWRRRKTPVWPDGDPRRPVWRPLRSDRSGSCVIRVTELVLGLHPVSTIWAVS